MSAVDMPEERPLTGREQRTLAELYARLGAWFRRAAHSPHVSDESAGNRLEFRVVSSGDPEGNRYVHVRITDATVSEVCE